ncbi:hypothetical protein GGR50DRAFT_698443 [Xylaria sp. CBS 124048]|nr:hypothetical protein GGR50DRAFT_698443 [Xylaria sp. CBS 124048]
MSTQSSLSSRAGSPLNVRPEVDEEALPSGNCRYILLNPEIKGQRCACVGFTLNRSQPGVSCLCGHSSCFHVKSTEIFLHTEAEMENVRRRVQMVEHTQAEMGSIQRRLQIMEGASRRFEEVIQRIGNLEEQFEKNREETNQELKGCYGNVTHMWTFLEQLKEQLKHRHTISESRFVSYDERLDSHADTLQRLVDKTTPIVEAQIALDERVEALEDRSLPSHSPGRRPQSSTSGPEPNQQPSSNYEGVLRTQPLLVPTHGVAQNPSSRTASSTQKTWTVHVSLLPSAAQPFPFEKDTNAYKRCLSRGLHQMVAVSGTDSESFHAAITKAFGSLLRGREWMPLQARLCDAVTLEGLPMLRPLEPGLTGKPYDLEFLRKFCAVCHPTGKVESLYIAMVHDTLSWHFLRRSPCHLDGLEVSWEYDMLLDPDGNLDGDVAGEADRPSAGDIMPPLPSLKRTASEISKAPDPNSVTEADGSRPKLARMQVDTCRRGVKTV